MKGVEELVARARTLLEEGRPDEAASALGSALEAAPEDLEATLLLGQISLGLGLVEESDLLAGRALALEPGNVEALVLQGLIEEVRDELGAALQTFAAAAAGDPDAYAGHYHLGRALTANGLYADAIPALQTAARLNPGATEPHYALGMAFRGLGDLASSIEAFAQTIEIDPAFLDGYVTLCDVLSEAGRLELAETVLLQAQSLAPDAASLAGKLAAVRLKKGDLPGMIEALREKVRLDPLDEEANVALYTAALAAADAQAAADAASSMLRNHPRSWQGPWMRAQVLDLADQPDRAIESLREAVRLAPQEWKPLNDLGSLLNAKALSSKPAAAEASQLLQQAAALAPADEPAPRYNLALALWNAERHDEARSVLRGLLAEIPDGHRVAARAREVLAAMESGTAATGQA